MSNQGNITSFFKPAPKLPQSPVPVKETSTAPPPPSPSPPPSSFSSSPPVPQPTVRDRNAVIQGSDDEDDDASTSSDEDFPELFSKPLPAPTRPLPDQAPKKDVGIYTTPKAKRRVLEFHSSPLTINTRHKFDIKALLKHAAADNAVEEGELRTASLMAPKSPTVRRAAEPNGAQTNFQDAMLGVLSDPEDSQGEGARRRLLQAVRRTEATVGGKEWYFFDRRAPGDSKAVKTRPPFPRGKATGVWSFLEPEEHRTEVFADGLAHNVQCRVGTLPDEIFKWVLSEAPVEKSKTLRDEYVRLLGVSPDQARRVLDENAVLGLFQDLGASERALGSGPQLDSYPEDGAPYPEQDRGSLQTVLRILSRTAYGLSTPALTRAMSILLRLGIDSVVREDQIVATEHQDALLQVAAVVPWRSWNDFCGEVSESLYNHTQEYTLRWNAVSAIPLLHPKLIDLRRRLALVFVYDDARRGFSSPDETFSIRSVIDRLDQADEFIVDRTNTDYFELLALSKLLSVAIGDGSPPADNSGPEAVKHYNAEVDELSQRIKFMWSNIHEQGAAYMSRLEVRVQLRDFERKLQHVVRTRPPPKEDIFGLNGAKEDLDRPKQQQFMKKFFSKEVPPPKTPPKGR
ncbi:hypothetical protein B0J18DRAFT_95008 [Chaetomium sp. MPI-SDFR-AT-0129]|nr:hypothetical protein B0J18DRAFT_95008 [Chaetomium sp. MPI-SDFR-AT-0129]